MKPYQLLFLILAVSVTATVAAADAKPSQGEKALFQFWSELLKGPVRAETWSADAKDHPDVVAAKKLLADGFGKLLAECQWEPGRKRIRLQPFDKIDTEQIVMGRYVSGKNQYIGLISPGPIQRIRIFFPDGEYQYEWIEHRFAGKSNGAGVVVVPNKVHWLAVYPYKIVGMSVKASRSEAMPGERLNVDLEIAGTSAPGLHCFRVMVAKPDGPPLVGYPQFVLAPRGRSRVEVTLPEDAAEGEYGISARCVVTAAIDGTTVSVRRPQRSPEQGVQEKN